jgi:hypothetical protein
MEPEFPTVTRGLEMLLGQLYYWARRAVEQRKEGSDSEVADRMLTLATENLERFVTTLLDCFRAIQLERMPVPASELVAALVRHVRDEGAAASVVGPEDTQTTVLADPAQLARVWSAIVRRFGPGACEVTAAPATRADRRGVDILVRRSGGADSFAERDVTMDLQWALALRVVELHGGELREDALSRAPAIGVFLPAE